MSKAYSANDQRPGRGVSLILFTLNEIDGLKAILPRIRPEWYDQLIIVDGGSVDGTLEYARRLGLDIFVQKEQGAGAAFLESMARVTGDIAVIFSPDGNSEPEKIPEAVAKFRQGYDVLIVSRYLDGARSYDDDLVTAVGNRMFTWLMRVLFRAPVTDCLVMYRVYRRDIIQVLGMDTRTVAWGTQLLARAARQGLRIGEIPGDEPPRIGGVRKMHPLKNGIAELSMMASEFFRKG